MANKKTVTTKGKAAQKNKNTAKKPGAKQAAPAQEKVRDIPDTTRLIHQVMPYLLIVCAIFITVCYFFEGSVGIVGSGIRRLCFGLFAGGAFCVPLFLVLHAVFWVSDVKNRAVASKFAFSFVCLVFVSVLIHTFGTDRTNLVFSPSILYKNGLDLVGGGIVGGLLAGLMLRAVGFSGTLLISISVLVIFGVFLFGFTPRNIWLYFAYKKKLRAERREAERKAAMGEPRPVRYMPVVSRTEPAAQPPDEDAEEKQAYTFRRSRRRFNPDVKIDDEQPGENPVDLEAYRAASEEEAAAGQAGDRMSENLRPVSQTGAAAKGLADTAERALDLNEIFANPSDIEMIHRYAREGGKLGEGHAADIELSVEKRRIIETKPEPTPIAKPAPPPVYQFPPVSLLSPGSAPRNAEAAAELQENAVKLVETLASFNVRTKIVSVSRGPTITRYELAPEAGTRVRSIANLVDDIALNLATSGIRIETPIPGKAAVGIEVPNRVVATVHLRELIDSDLFAAAQSKLTACLGVDVAGSPIIIDLAKMPHLLIAGATGMGKSVCMNSIIVSLLYKATPDEVKLILVDPKKVELNVYNGIPHLLVPVVTDPKKAAGSLHWAVTEMERRFELIEQFGVRNIQNYNNLVKKSGGSMEYMPQIVILIDELADLMMTAPDAVEESINRLAQKARAAGMHLILGTQRPSVDVITGLIKANIPSRIAFTVASQVDSRTIIDIAGAEKLIGRGDMLYAPVGSSKPIRAQGAFVSEAEVEAVTDFIKQNIGLSEYNSEVIESIEREAARCVQGKRAAMEETDGDENADPMLRQAIELAIECGKISTSLIQRRLSLGYGRAAKLIDKMERLGYVSPPDGQKPREVLITKQQYMEMVVRDEDLG